nr:skin secretory protein xP2-like [Misgurnus anguillicaudatus]
MEKNKVLAKKRLRVPTQKMKDLNSPPLNEKSGCVAFVRWEDGYTGKIFKGSDILARDEAPVQLQDLRSGDLVLAKWSDGKFYKATIEYVSGEDQAKLPKGHPTPQESFLNMLKGDEPSDITSGSDTIIIDRSPLSEHGEKIPSLNPSPDGGHATGRNTAGPPPYGSAKGGTIGPSLYRGNTPSPSPYSLNTSGPSPGGGHTPSPSPYSLNTSGPSPGGGHAASPSAYSLNTIGPSPYRGHTPSPSPYSLNTSGPSPGGGHTPSPSLYDLNTSGPSPGGGHTPSPSLYDLNTSGPSPGGGHTPSPSPYSLNTSGPSPGGGHTPSPSLYDLNTSAPSPGGGHTPSPSPYSLNTSGPSPGGGHTPSPSLYSLNTSGPSPGGGHTPSPSPYSLNTSGPSPGRGHAARPQENAWTPCQDCKGEFERILQEKRRIDEVISRIDPGQVRELQTLCDLIGERHCGSPASPSGQQELFPGSGIFISSFRLAAMNHASKPNCMRLFHALFDHFFTVEECQNAVPFGRPGNNPSGKQGKQVLDRKKVDGILTYVLRCATLPDWEPIEEAKLKKAFVNKCRARAGSKE